VDFVILQMEEDDRVPLILGRPFLHTADAIIRVKNQEINLGIGEDRATFHIDKAMQHSHVNDDTCFRMKTSDIPGIRPSFCKRKINFEDDVKPVIQRQRLLNPNMKEVVNKEIIKLLDAVVFTDQAAIKYLFSKQDAKPRLIRWILLLQEFDIEIKNKKGAENVTADHLSRLEKPNLKELKDEEINNEFPDEFLMSIKDEEILCFIVNGHRVQLYHDEEQLNELTIEDIHLMCEEESMKAIPFMAPFPANFLETMP
nr:reverse transcriptase domain-containing protein [Tanacetum cinerariifolium]